MLKKIRVALALVFYLGITLLLLDISGGLHQYLGWMAKVQFVPALLAGNAAVIAGLAVLTLLFGRVYCSIICPLGVLQDGISHLGTRGSKKPYKYHKEVKWLRYGVWVLFVAALLAGVQVAVSLLAPYSAYGRMVSSLLQPLYLWGNNLLALLSERAGSYAFYSREVCLKSLPTLLIALGTLTLIIVLALKGGRRYCNGICPVGTTLGFLSRFAMFRPVIDESKCVRCRGCELHCKARCIEVTKERVHIDYSRCVDCFDCIDACSAGGLKYRFAWKRHPERSEGSPDKGRRAFFAGTAVAVGAAALKGVSARAQEAATKVDGGLADILPKQAPAREVPVTPPGSASVKDFYKRCTACQLCVSACPNNVLRPSGNLERLMQPEMSFEKGFCRPECTRCGEVCPAGAILPVTREQKTQYHVGTARVNPELCLEATGESHCGHCRSVCPSGAITLVKTENGHRIPAVAEAVCSGCGACEYLCPVRPVSAITINGKHDHL